MDVVRRTEGAGGTPSRRRRRVRGQPDAPERQQRSGVRVLRTDEELRRATERALVFERERVQASADRAYRYQHTLERVVGTRPVTEASSVNSHLTLHRLPSADPSSDGRELRQLT
jgi:hypothetical protein